MVFRIEGLGLRVYNLGFRVWGLWLSVEGLELRGWYLGGGGEL